MTRGILSTVYMRLTEDLSTAEALDMYAKFCSMRMNPLFGCFQPGPNPQTKAVLGSNYCDVGLEVDTRTQRIVAMAAIDNLGKGAAGAVVQNLNLMFGFKETDGLKVPGMMP